MQFPHYEKAIQCLEEAKNSEPGLIEYYAFYQKIFHLQQQTRAQIDNDSRLMDEDVLIERAKGGLPQLSFSQLPIDPQGFQHLASKIARTVLEYQMIEEPDQYSHDQDWYKLAMARFYETPRMDMSEPYALIAFLATLPYMEFASEHMMPHLVDISQNKSRCPVCSGLPGFSYLDRKNGRRWLFCTRCRSEWVYARLRCPYCKRDEPDGLRYYPAGEHGKYRLYVCDACKRYLKAVDLRNTVGEISLMAEDVITWSLDRKAIEMGYH